MGPALDVDNITEKLPDTFKVGLTLDLCSNTYMFSVMLSPPFPSHSYTQTPLEEAFLKRLEYEFHSASYHTLVEVVTALRTVAEHLVKVTPAAIGLFYLTFLPRTLHKHAHM